MSTKDKSYQRDLAEDVSYQSYWNKKLRDFGPLANYVDRATAACWQLVSTFADRGCCVVSATDPPGR
jgi:hypothetical protein